MDSLEDVFYETIAENNTRELRKLLHKEEIEELITKGAEYAVSIGSDESYDMLQSYLLKRNYVQGPRPQKEIKKRNNKYLRPFRKTALSLEEITDEDVKMILEKFTSDHDVDIKDLLSQHGNNFATNLSEIFKNYGESGVIKELERTVEEDY